MGHSFEPVCTSCKGCDVLGAEGATGLLVRKREISYVGDDEVTLFSGVVQTSQLLAAKQITSWTWHPGQMLCQ